MFIADVLLKVKSAIRNAESIYPSQPPTLASSCVQ